MSNYLSVNQEFLKDNGFNQDPQTGDWVRDDIRITLELVTDTRDSTFQTMVQNLIIKNDQHE